MGSTGFGLLSLLVFLPAIGALIVALMPEQFPKAIKGFAMAVAVADFLVSLAVLAAFQSGTFHFQLVEYVPWMPQLGINYILGVDGISIWLVVLTTFLMVVSCWFSFYVQHRVKAYFAFLLILQAAMLGVFLSLDMILFYVFFEASLVPMAAMIAIWGGAQRRYAAVKFFIYTFAASIFLLVGMIAMAKLHADARGVFTFDLLAIQNAVAQGDLWANALRLQPVLFWAFAIAFMVKCPMFPFHTWLPDAHTEAPTAGSIILAGVLLKMGTYGFLRFSMTLFPDVIGDQIVIIMLLAVIGIIYGAIVAAMQPDVKKLVAYSSVAHMGFVIIGIFSLTHTGLVGGAYQQLSHGISTGGLFLLIGLLYERIHTRMFKDMGGLKVHMPIFAALFLIVMLSSVGLPGLNGFVGEFLALMGAFQVGVSGAFGLGWWLPAVAGIGVILAAVYLLWMYQKVFYGPVLKPENARLRDLKPHEIALVGLLIVFVFWGGIYPNTFLKPMEASLGAVRHMALNPAGLRPSWTNLNHEIDSEGNFIEVEERTRNSILEEYTAVSTIYPSRHYNHPATMGALDYQAPAAPEQVDLDDTPGEEATQ